DAGAREVLAGEAPVVADDDAAGGGTGLLEVLGAAAGTAPHVVDGVLLGDGRAPAIGPELDPPHRIARACTQPLAPGRCMWPANGADQECVRSGGPLSARRGQPRMRPDRGARASRSPTPMR